MIRKEISFVDDRQELSERAIHHMNTRDSAALLRGVDKAKRHAADVARQGRANKNITPEEEAQIARDRKRTLDRAIGRRTVRRVRRVEIPKLPVDTEV